MKILIISPTPTHPVNAGNRLRIYTFCELLKQNGYEVHFLYNEIEKYDKAQMDEYFEGRLHVFNAKKYLKKLGVQEKLKHFRHRKVRRYSKKLKNLLPVKGNLKYNYTADYYYDYLLDTYIKNNLAPLQFTHVLAEYVVYSRAFQNFGENVLKITDTHDRLTDRYKIYLENNSKPEFFSLSQSEEAKGLNRSDYAIAIQQDDKEYFDSISQVKTEVIGHFQKIVKIETPQNSNILFVGSGNKINIDGINHFIENVFPDLVKNNPSAKLLIAGNICKSQQEIKSHPSITFLGAYDNPETIYSECVAVIIPLQYGTGLKIKTIEALSFGKAVITYDEGIKGLPRPSTTSPYCLLAESDAEFLSHLSKVMQDIPYREALQENAIAFMENYNRENMAAFNRIFK